MRKPRVVIVDDDQFVSEMLTAFFSARGYEVISFSNPLFCPLYKENAGSCHASEPCADLLITDYRMPLMNGVEFLTYLRQRGCRLASNHKAIMTGKILSEEDEQRIKTLGCMYFVKPFRLSTIVNWLDACEPFFNLSQPLGNLHDH